MHKQQDRVLNHLQILRIAVGFSGEPREIVPQKNLFMRSTVYVCAFSVRCFVGSIRLYACQWPDAYNFAPMQLILLAIFEEYFVS